MIGVWTRRVDQTGQGSELRSWVLLAAIVDLDGRDKIDQGLVGLGCQGRDADLRDENGNPVPETVRKVDMKAMRFILEWYRPDTWGKRPKRNAPREGGVLVVGDVTKKPKYNTDASVKARKWKSGWRWIREEKD